MKATCWMGPQKMQVVDVPDPQLLNRRDAIVRVTSTAICGSDLHLYNGYMPTMQKGDILGHEFMGEVVEVGRDVKNLRVGDRVVVPFPIACGACNACKADLWAACENSNPNAYIAETMLGHSPAGIFGYSHLTGGFAGGQAEYARVPFADVGPLKVPEGMHDEEALFLSDIFPTGYMGAEMADIKPGDTVAVWGCGPVGLFAIASAYLLGAERVFAIDRFEYRLKMAREGAGAITINYSEVDHVPALLKELTGGRGPDKVIEAVGLEAHGHGPLFLADKIKQSIKIHPDRAVALREAIYSVANGGTVSVIGVYAGLVDKFPMNAVVNRGLTIRAGQCHAHRYMRPLLDRIQAGDIDPRFVITHRMPLADAAKGYEIFCNKQDNCEKVVLTA
ncbi:MAG: glutathione-dependent formaldehyde dehydrogenase [Gemmatimonadaceae bacterium]|jgi:threonine dehydrogenase-like Zn-dependent dehydrogenase|nr:glutathione-dependent formaldehyde dehydrogenase [Gemmatimonadaceae bacterium]